MAEWWIWWLQQHGGQQQRGQLLRVLVVVRVVVAVLTNAIGNGPKVAKRCFGDLVRVGQQRSQRVILPSSSGPFSPLHAWFRTLGGFVLVCVTRCARTCANEVAALPLRRTR